MDYTARCTRCLQVKAGKEFRPYLLDGVLVRPDVCRPCAVEVDRIRKTHPLDAWLAFIRRAEMERSKREKRSLQSA